jgi:hypothetical protein
MLGWKGLPLKNTSFFVSYKENEVLFNTASQNVISVTA